MEKSSKDGATEGFRRPNVCASIVAADGCGACRVEVDPAEIDKLISRGYLEAGERHDLMAIGEAIGAFISDVLVLSDGTT